YLFTYLFFPILIIGKSHRPLNILLAVFTDQVHDTHFLVVGVSKTAYHSAAGPCYYRTTKRKHFQAGCAAAKMRGIQYRICTAYKTEKVIKIKMRQENYPLRH